MGFYDNHNHSQFSFDGKRASVETSAAAAMTYGLEGMCFTDHCDFYVPPMKASFEDLKPETFDIPAQQAEIDRVNSKIAAGIPLRTNVNPQTLDGENNAGAKDPDGNGTTREFSGKPKFKIYRGIEIGLYNSCREQIRETLARNSFDEVIASVHYIDDTDPFWGGYYEGKTWKEAYGHYLETLCEEMIWLGDFDIMGHFDYVARYAPYPKASILYRDFPDQFDTMLRYLAYEGKALEINTKTYQTYTYRPHTPSTFKTNSPTGQPGTSIADTSDGIDRTPELDPNILRRYREFGGEMISLGSDSHDPVRPGDKFDYFAAFTRSCGFKWLVHFSCRKPQFQSID